MIAHIGTDGSGKSYGMAQDAHSAILREEKKKHGLEVWSIKPIVGAKRIRDPRQIIYLENAIIFLDELQKWCPADRTVMDEIMQEVISEHRHDHNVIHWASQDWKYVHPFIRYQTTLAWKYEAIHRDRLTGESHYCGIEWLHRHRRDLVNGVDMERERRRPDIMRTEKFWITKKGIALFNSYEKMEVIGDDTTADIIAKLPNPHYAEENLSSTDKMIYPNTQTESEHPSLVSNNEIDADDKSLPVPNQSDDAKPVADIRRPRSGKLGKRVVFRKGQEKDDSSNKGTEQIEEKRGKHISP